MDKDTVKIRYWVATNKVGSKCEDHFELDRKIWEEMDEREREGFMLDSLAGFFEWGFEVVED